MQISMSRKHIFLVGAPLSSCLDWDTDELLSTPIPPFDNDTGSPEEQPSPDQPTARWRVLRSSVDKLGDNYDTFQQYEDPAFFISHQLAVATNVPQGNSEDSILQFYDHSFAIHETSEVVSSDLYVADTTQESSLGEDSELASFTGLDNPDIPRSPRILHIPGPLGNLQDIPTARYIQSIAPQTMTVNLIVGVLAIHPPRRIVTRQWKTELDLVELVVGDETRAGFGVSFWLKPEKPTAAKNNEADRLGRSLASLRPRDIVLLRTVGLSTFQGRVYGQSLRRGMTTVELLHRRPVDVTDAVGFYQGRIQEVSPHDDRPVLKARRVRNWMLRFVTDSVGMSNPRGLPPDTQ
ncbi:Nucleic acid-binding, OB-fold [Penicillium italicum]|uniref:Nucleic acid-binding, OB-fold n=1 Tax=Penicillium italicum TaxID=40296 RepID=A0A0A2LEL9_PENIT|nr:Nucleic acid-binding, OB-fold [Penicillium italicum]